MQYIIGLDDTDNTDSRGTGQLARALASALAAGYQVHGVTRHQLLDDARVPKTARNSCAAVLFEGDPVSLDRISACARKLVLDDFQPGSDPGLCVAASVPDEIVRFGRRAQSEFLFQGEARKLAAAHGLLLEGLGGDQGGVIGALAAVGLAAHGSDGRYVWVGSVRDLEGLQPVEAVLAAGIKAVRTLAGRPVTGGLVMAGKLRPARRDAQPVLFVERQGHNWLPLKLD